MQQPGLFMRYQKTAVVLLLFFLLLPACACAAETSRQTMKAMLEGVDSDIENHSKAVQELRMALPAMIQHLDARMDKTRNRLDQLMLLRGMAKRTPWAYRTLIVQLEDLNRYVELSKGSLILQKDRLKSIKETFKALSGLDLKPRLETTEIGPLLEKTENNFKKLSTESSALKKEIDAELTRADKISLEIKADRKSTLSYYAEAMKGYYFSQGPSLLNRHDWRDISFKFKEWRQGVLKFWHPLFIWVEWSEFLFYFAAITAALWQGLRTSISRILKRPAFSEHSMRDYNAGVFFIAAGIGVYAATNITIFTFNQITGLVWTQLLTLGIITIARNFLWAYENDRPAPLFKTPLFTLWMLMVSGDIIHMLALPASCVGLPWLILSTAGLFRMLSNRKYQHLPATRVTANLSLKLLLLGIIFTLFGFGTQVMIVTQIWFMLLVSLITSHGSNSDEIETKGETTAQHVAPPSQVDGRQLARLVYPLSVSIIILLFVGWAMAYMGGVPFARFVMRNMDLTIAGVDISLRSIFHISILFFSARLLLFWLRSLAHSGPIGGKKIESSVLHTLTTIGTYLVWIFFVLISLYLLGVKLSALTWIASGLSVGIGFGMKDIVNNFVSGLIIMFGGSIKKGDIIQRNQVYGEVVDVSIRNTTIRTLENTMMIIPNSSFLKGEIVNLNFKDSRVRVAIPITLAPGSKIKKAKKVMLKVAKKHPNVLTEPEPFVFFKKFGVFGLDFELYVWVNDFRDQYQTESDLINEIDEKLQAKKIKVAFRGVKMKYKPKGDEAAQLEAQRENIRQKRKNVFKSFRKASTRRFRNLPRIEKEPEE